MDTVTYPDPAVATTINQHLVPLQINTQQEAGTPVIERYRQIWTPDIRILGADGFEYYRWNGYLPPFEFLPQLLVAEAQAYLRLNQLQQGAALYAEVLRRFPTGVVASEAQYYLAVAQYKQSHEGADLQSGWQQLQRRYPESLWRLKQSFSETG